MRCAGVPNGICYVARVKFVFMSEIIPCGNCEICFGCKWFAYAMIEFLGGYASANRSTTVILTERGTQNGLILSPRAPPGRGGGRTELDFIHPSAGNIHIDHRERPAQSGSFRRALRHCPGTGHRAPPFFQPRRKIRVSFRRTGEKFAHRGGKTPGLWGVSAAV